MIFSFSCIHESMKIILLVHLSWTSKMIFFPFLHTYAYTMKIILLVRLSWTSKMIFFPFLHIYTYTVKIVLLVRSTWTSKMIFAFSTIDNLMKIVLLVQLDRTSKTIFSFSCIHELMKIVSLVQIERTSKMIFSFSRYRSCGWRRSQGLNWSMDMSIEWCLNKRLRIDAMVDYRTEVYRISILISSIIHRNDSNFDHVKKAMEYCGHDWRVNIVNNRTTMSKKQIMSVHHR